MRVPVMCSGPPGLRTSRCRSNVILGTHSISAYLHSPMAAVYKPERPQAEGMLSQGHVDIREDKGHICSATNSGSRGAGRMIANEPSEVDGHPYAKSSACLRATSGHKQTAIRAMLSSPQNSESKTVGRSVDRERHITELGSVPNAAHSRRS